MPNGVIMDEWTPAAEGRDFILPQTLAPLAPFQDQVTVVSGLQSEPMFPLPGEGTGDHVRAASAFLTGVHPKKTEGPDIRGGTLDGPDRGREDRPGHPAHVARARPRPQRAHRGVRGGLELRLRQHPVVAQPDDAAARWRTSRGAVFERLFGDTDDTSQEARLARIREDRSILDSLVHEVDDFRHTLAPADRDKVNQYLDAIRDIERRIQLAEAQSHVELPELARPTGASPTRSPSTRG